MDAALLSRDKPKGKTKGNDSLNVEVHERAKRMFGYGQALDGLYSENLRISERKALFDACRSLGIAYPFTSDSVEKYKEKVVADSRKKHPTRNRGRWDEVRTTFSWEQKPLLQHVKGAYTQPVPEFALQTACDLKEKLPHLEFFVEELVRKTERTRKPMDPFLVVRDSSGTNYYLEVWNEPGYKHERMV